MNLRLSVALSTLILLLAACTSVTTTQPTEAPPLNQPPAEATQAPAPTAAFTPTPPVATEPGLPFELISTAFEQGGLIPEKHTCDGEDVSPSLAWGDPPPGTKSLALIMDDPDAPGATFDHWVLFNISPELRELPEAVPADTSFAGMIPTSGVNSFGRSRYDGPCPPFGTHRYFFKLYALDTILNLDAGATKEQVLKAMEGHILAEAELMGTYIR